MRKFNKPMALFCAVAVLPSCVSGGAQYVHVPKEDIERTIVSTRVFTDPGKCNSGVDDEDAESGFLIEAITGLLTTLAGAAVEKAVDAAVAAVAAQGEDKPVSIAANTRDYLFALNSEDGKISTAVGCLTFVRGYFGPVDIDSFAGTVFESEVENGEIENSKLVNMGLARPPTVLAKFDLEHSVRNKSFAAELSYLYYGNHLQFGAKKDRDVLFTITFEDGTKPASKDRAFANYTMTLPDITPPLLYVDDSAGRITGKWAPFPGKIENMPDSSGRFSPVDITITMTETRKGSKFFKALGEILEGNKDDIKKTGNEIILRIFGEPDKPADNGDGQG